MHCFSLNTSSKKIALKLILEKHYLRVSDAKHRCTNLNLCVFYPLEPDLIRLDLILHLIVK